MDVLADPCPICGREMRRGRSIDRHHFVPRSRGGRQTEFVHRICHRKLHSLFTEKQLASEFSTPEAIHADPDMAAFIRWVRRKPAEYYDNSRTAKRKRR